MRLWVLLAICGAAIADRRYLFTVPKVLVGDTKERACITLFDVPETGQLTLTLHGNDFEGSIAQHIQEVSGVAGGSKQTCFFFDVPEKPPSSGNIELEVDFPSEANYRIKEKQEIIYRTVGGETTFIQTDKSLYKPGQLVRFRILTVKSDLTPVTDPLPLVYIESPAGTRLAQWSDVSGEAGLSQLEFQLADEPQLGSWKIVVTKASGDKESKEFKVDEYVLPKFEVQINSPPFILGDAKTVSWNVCGKYTYGKPVQGEVKFTISIDHRSGPEEERHTDEDGCAKFEVTGSQLGLDTYRRRPFSVSIDANLTEDGTEASFSASRTDTVSYTALNLNTEDSGDKYFKPGLYYLDQIKVTHPDGSPAAGETVQLCYKVKFNKTSDDDDGPEPIFHHWNRWRPVETNCRNVSSDSAGVVDFAVPPQPQIVQEITITATLPRHPETKYPKTDYGYFPTWMYTSSHTFTLRGWYSESGSFVQLDKRPGHKYACGTTADIPVHFVTDLGRQFDLFYQVMGRGDIVVSETVPVSFDQPTVVTSVLDESNIIHPPNSTDPQTDKATGRVTLKIPVTPKLSSGFKVLVYLLDGDEVVADGQRYEALPCLENDVTLSWSQSQVRPSETVQLSLAASPGSLCGLDVVDKSVNLLGSSHRISLSQVFDILKRYVLSRYDGYNQVQDYKYCREKYGDPDPPRPPSPPPPGPEFDIPADLVMGEGPERKKRSSWPGPTFRAYWESPYVDSLTAFDRVGWLVASDAILEVRPCFKQTFNYDYTSPYYEYDSFQFDDCGPAGCARVASNFEPMEMELPQPVAAVAVLSDSQAGVPQPAVAPSEVPEVVRTYFPETWLFDIQTVGADGTVSLTQEVPDTITEWVGGAVCSSTSAGMGVSRPASLTAFQPFFVTYTLPYSVKRGEILVLKVSVFNYNQHSLPIKVTLADSEEFERLSDQVQTICAPSSTPEVLQYRIRPTALGDVNITVVAEVYPDFPAECGPEVVLNFQDAITRPVLVEPEGYEREFTKSSFMCVTPGNAALSSSADDQDVTWPLTLPDDLVPGSERASVMVVGDLLGPSIDNLESLVRLPTGCGEQNMVKFAPNIHVMGYLSSSGDLTEDLKQKLKRYMKTGYQRELTYRHTDYSYSAFGNRDDSGSTWLTAFVVKSFAQAKQYIFVDEEDLSKSVGWLENHQMENGCFHSVGRVLHKAMKGGVASSGETGLTAYIAAVLVQAGVDLRPNTLKNAFSCLEQDVDPSIYTLTLTTYAYALAGKTELATEGMEQLLMKASKDSGLIWWQNSESEENLALSVEIGSYNVLTMQLLQKLSPGTDYFSEALGAVRWINQQRNSHGGFVSTQDTVLALEALAVFSADLPGGGDDLNLRLHVTDSHQLDDLITVQAANRLLVQSREVTQLPAEVHVTAEGEGCALVQTTLKYNVKTATPSEALTIDVSSSPSGNTKTCLKHKIHVCVSYTADDGESNMAVVEVAMVSGFIPHKESLEQLKSDTKLNLKRWEVSRNRAIFYFEALDGDQRCFDFLVQREQEVEDIKDAVAVVYDYYQAEFSKSTSYSLDVECRSEREPEPPVILPLPVPVPLEAEQPGARAAGRAEEDDWAPGRFSNFVDSDDIGFQPEPPGGLEGNEPRFAKPPPNFFDADSDSSDQDCPLCLETVRDVDFQYYFCEYGSVDIGSLKADNVLRYQSHWGQSGPPRKTVSRQTVEIPDSCQCKLRASRPLFIFGVTSEQRGQERLRLTEEHALGLAPATYKLRRHQINKARKADCQ